MNRRSEAIDRNGRKQAVRLHTMYDGKISESFYERKAGERRAEQDRIAEAIQDHRRADRN